MFFVSSVSGGLCHRFFSFLDIFGDSERGHVWRSRASKKREETAPGNFFEVKNGPKTDLLLFGVVVGSILRDFKVPFYTFWGRFSRIAPKPLLVPFWIYVGLFLE